MVSAGLFALVGERREAVVLPVAIAPLELVQADLDQGRLAAPWGFVETGGQWALCTTRGSDDARIPALAAWLRTELQPGR